MQRPQSDPWMDGYCGGRIAQDDPGDSNDYAGGPLVMSADWLVKTETPEFVRLPPQHRFDENGICMRCQRNAADLANDPYLECLISAPYLDINKSVAGG